MKSIINEYLNIYNDIIEIDKYLLRESNSKFIPNKSLKINGPSEKKRKELKRKRKKK